MNFLFCSNAISVHPIFSLTIFYQSQTTRIVTMTDKGSVKPHVKSVDALAAPTGGWLSYGTYRKTFFLNFLWTVNSALEDYHVY